ncbi:MAG: AAA family ATPase [Yersinia sp. (in: enterobacteria)]|jgi:chromosome partitioning protein|nr:ParA family protein [Yersinia enterocolitica]
MKVVSFINPKGGVGKSTSVINVATCLVRSGHSVAVVDTDPQMSLTNWNKSGKANFAVFTADSEKDVYQIRKELKNYDYAIVDGAASLSVITSAAVMVSDLIIIPVSPSPLDFSASGAVLTVIEAQAFNRPVEARFLITRKVNNASMLTLLKDSIKQTGIERFKTALSHRQTYIKTLVDGDTVFDSKDSAAKGEVEVLTKEIIDTLTK